MSLEQLMNHAEWAKDHAYAPYSDYRVGAAVLCDNGRIATGYNVEISGRSTSTHAEMMALFNAVRLSDDPHSHQAIAVAHDGDQGPCALCLHTLSEFVEDMDIIIEVDDELCNFSLSEEFNNAYRPKDSHERRDLND